MYNISEGFIDEKAMLPAPVEMEDGTESEPEVYELEEIDHTMKLSRRGFVALSALAAMMASGCVGNGPTTAPAVSPATGPSTIPASGLAHSKVVLSVAFHPDGLKIASGSMDGSIKIWDVKSGALLNTIAGLDAVDSVAFSPDGTKIAGASEREALIWDVAQQARCLKG